MTNILKLSTALASGVAAVSMSSALASDTVLRGFVGATFGGEATLEAEYSGVSVSYDVDLDTGFVVGGAFGVDFGDFTVDGEIGYRSTALDGSYAYDEDVALVSALANGWYELGLTENLELYAGGGVGVAAGIVDDVDSSLGFAFQAGGGARFIVGPGMDIGVGYRYFNASNVLDDEGVSVDYTDSTVLAEVRFKF